MLDEVSWGAKTLRIGQTMTRTMNGKQVSIAKTDRRDDPYLAGVISSGKLNYTGLHSTLPDARKSCEEKSRC